MGPSLNVFETNNFLLKMEMKRNHKKDWVSPQNERWFKAFGILAFGIVLYPCMQPFL